ncbi:MAG: phosphotransferase, partial [Pirellulales bacterium]
GLGRFQPISWKRSAFRRVVGWSMLLGVDRPFCTIADVPIEGHADFDFDGWLEQVRADLNEPEATAVVFWHPRHEETPNEKRKRAIVHLFDRQLRPIGFAKISFDEQNDRRLQKEAEAIGQLQQLGLRQFRFPRVLLHRQHADHSYLLLEPLPTSGRPVDLTLQAFPRPSVREYAGAATPLPAEHVENLSWWGRYKHAIGERCNAFADELAERIGSGVEVCRVHGDMQPSNILWDGDDVWIFDWEDSCPDGPVMLDEINFYMVIHLSQSASDPDGQRARFFDRFLRDAGPERRLAVMLALAFRATIHLDDAMLMMEHWNR